MPGEHLLVCFLNTKKFCCLIKKEVVKALHHAFYFQDKTGYRHGHKYTTNLNTHSFGTICMMHLMMK